MAEDNITDWTWCWLDDDDNWVPYSEGLDSVAIEQRYRRRHSFVMFTAGNQKYTLDFVRMIQTNVHYGTEREVQRRQVCELEALTDNTTEYNTIAELFWNTTVDKRRSIVRIQRVENKQLQQEFLSEEYLMLSRSGGVDVNHTRLFHGTTSESALNICKHNFDMDLCGINVGIKYGQGSYFARDAELAHNYTEVDTNGYRYVIVARVLIGSFTTGRPEYTRPPGNHDSCVDDVRNPKIYVIFERGQIYPEYLITYKDESSHDNESNFPRNTLKTHSVPGWDSDPRPPAYVSSPQTLSSSNVGYSIAHVTAKDQSIPQTLSTSNPGYMFAHVTTKDQSGPQTSSSSNAGYSIAHVTTKDQSIPQTLSTSNPGYMFANVTTKDQSSPQTSSSSNAGYSIARVATVAIAVGLIILWLKR